MFIWVCFWVWFFLIGIIVCWVWCVLFFGNSRTFVRRVVFVCDFSFGDSICGSIFFLLLCFLMGCLLIVFCLWNFCIFCIVLVCFCFFFVFFVRVRSISRIAFRARRFRVSSSRFFAWDCLLLCVFIFFCILFFCILCMFV